METPAPATTTITQVEMSMEELNDILGTPGSEVVMTPNEAVEKPSIFTTKKVNTAFLNEPPAKEKPAEEGTKEPVVETPPVKKDVTAEEIDDLVSIPNPDAEPSSTGRPKTDKNGLIEFTNKMIEKGLIMPFDEDKPIDKYSLDDFQELFEANISDRERKLRETVPVEFYDALPDEMQYAAKYIMDGGTDLKGLFRTLAASEEIKALDPKEEKNHKIIVRSYLQAKQFGTEEEIEDEIEKWADRDELEAKALQFKPKLDAMQERVVAQKLKQQEETRKMREQQSQLYMDNVYNTLEPGELNGIKLDRKMQGFLFSGLIEPRYPSLSGKPTNLLGHLLEKYQFVEPNHGLIAEALWLLSDPDSYKEKVKESGKKETTEKHVRMLKTEQASRISSTEASEENVPTKPNQGKLARPSANFFKR